MASKRKKYDHSKRTSQLPISVSEHMENVVYTHKFIQRLRTNTQTFRDYELLTLVHRFTFYGKHINDYPCGISVRAMIEKIYTDTIIPQCSYVDGVFNSVLNTPLPIHAKRREAIAKFLEEHWVSIFKIKDRRAYTQVIYASNLEHKMYLKLIESKCPINKFIDQEVEREHNKDFIAQARKYNVTTERLAV